MKKKATYRIRDWSEYNASLKQRGSGAIWVSSEAVKNWTTDELTRQPGASPTYTDLAIETVATVQAIYGLAGHQTQGFLQSVANKPLKARDRYSCNKAAKIRRFNISSDTLTAAANDMQNY